MSLVSWYATVHSVPPVQTMVTLHFYKSTANSVVACTIDVSGRQYAISMCDENTVVNMVLKYQMQIEQWICQIILIVVFINCPLTILTEA